ncbi:MAG: phosphoribosylglycinamide formyltransferase [Rhodospirillales bacterium]|nr:phosphoribosylglycinamide formyltransferase [Alphaproteobacteria bacterium]MCB9986332.1 phosphoribosylglycinamide formyltransferase [Rhodospirillales bacterium]USO07118.1 MAG: phosphoribosylglycinamide formyltransferase [Rhodospirillales bacterium]
MKTLRLAVLISGRGSNLQALIDACKKPDYPAEIAVVISNIPDAAGLARAAAAGLPVAVVDHRDFRKAEGFDKAGFETALAQIAEQHATGLVCLAGFMRILGPVFLKRFKDKVINIHPSLLPRHKGLHVHEAVLAAGDTVSGCSVHVVSEGMDEGPVIDQRAVPVHSGDTPEILAARVLEQEHVLYPAVVAQIARGDIVIEGGHITAGRAEKTKNSEKTS